MFHQNVAVGNLVLELLAEMDGWAWVNRTTDRAGRGGGGFFDRAPVGVARFFENFTESQTKKPNSDFNGFKGNSGIIENSVALPVLCYIRRTIIASFQIKKTMQIECS